MKKVIFSLAIFAATSLSIMAATDNKTNDNNTKTECCKEGKGDCKKADGRKSDSKKRKDKIKDRMVVGDKGDHGMRVFEGLNLTDAQKTQLEELRKKNEEKRKEMRTKMDKEMKEGSKEKPDFKNMSDEEKKKYQEEKQKLKAEMKARRAEEKKKFLNDIKSILTPEQYTKFLENYNDKPRAKHTKSMKNDDKKKIGMHAKKGNTVTKTVTA